MNVAPVLAVIATIVGVLTGEHLGASVALSSLVGGFGGLVASWCTVGRTRAALAVVGIGLVGLGFSQRATAGANVSLLTSQSPPVFHGELVDDPTPSRFSTRALVRVAVAGSHRTVIARSSGDDAVRLAALEAGDRVELEGRIAPLHGGLDAQARVRHAVARLDGARVLAMTPPSGVLGIADPLRNEILRGTRPLPSTPRALAAGFLLGDTRSVPPNVVDDYRNSGLSHLLAVSGENVAFVLALFRPVLERLRLGWRTLLALAVIAVFAAMTRFEPSVLRASAMAAVALLATFVGRPTARLRVLSYAVIVLLVADPFLVHSVGFALSCGAAAGITLLEPVIAAHLRGPRWFRDPLAVSLAAQVGVLPVLLATFGSFPVVTPLANVAAAPAAEALGVYGFAASAISGVVPRLGPLLHQPTAVLVGWVTAVARAGAAVPLTLDGRGVALVVSISAAVASVGFGRGRRSRPPPPAR